MAILDTAVTLTNLRDAIKNQAIAVEEVRITLEQSKYEPPATIRQAEINLDKQQRALEQRIKNYELRKARALTNIRNSRRHYAEGQELVKSLQTFLGQFTNKGPITGDALSIRKNLTVQKKNRITGESLRPCDCYSS
ncbi:MAG: hypothetical protein MZV63_14870 [Marinilabiliales bacterium]|nr:hypothetical protein [Marinilabiliales bacterium]